MDPLSLSASIAGLISITDMIAGRSYTYVKEARGASKEVRKLLEEITDLFGVLNSLRLVASRYEQEQFDSTMQSQHIYTCHTLLEKIKDQLDKADPSQVNGKKSQFHQKASMLGRTLIWPFSSTETKGLIAEVEKQKATLSLALAADGMTTLIEALSQQKAQGKGIAEIRENLAEQTLSLLSSERRRMLDTIGPYDPSGHQNIAVKLRQPGTGVWFTEGPQFKTWLGTRNAKMWLYGIPGAGKTVLTGSIIQAANNQFEQSNGIAFFYCDYKDSRTHDPLVILGALIRQLTIQDTRCLAKLEDFYKHHYPAPGSQAVIPITPEGFCELLQSMSTCFDDVMIIIDALDECGSDRSHVVELLASLNNGGQTNIKTLFASRLETDIEIHLQDYERISIAATSSDLKLYVASEIESRSRKGALRIRNEGLKKEIADRLVEGAEGMFRWVACQLDYLCELNTDKQLRKALSSLPPTLFSTYERILDRVNASNEDTQQLVQRVLTWIICSRQPLSTKELLQAVSINEGDTELDLEAMSDEEGILKWCSSLVRKTPDGDRLELAHFTVAEFLLAIGSKDSNTQKSSYTKYHVSPADQDLSLAKLSLTYLLFDNFRDKDWTGEDEFDEFIEGYDFYHYASDYWYQHAENHRDDDVLLDLAQVLFDPSKTNNFLHWSHYWTWTIKGEERIELSNASTLHFAASLSLYAICEWLIQEKGCESDLDKLSSIGTPLFCAFTGDDIILGMTGNISILTSPKRKSDKDGRKRTLEYLIEAGAQVNNTKLHPNHDWTALSLAFSFDFCWDILLERGVLVDDMCLEKVKYQPRSDRAEKFILGVGDKNLSDDMKPKYINVALEMKKTRQRAVDMISRTSALKTGDSIKDASALCKAAFSGQVQVVRQLLQQHDIEIEFRDAKAFGGTALHNACENSHLEIIKVLIDHGATIDINDEWELTPFLLAAEKKSLEVVRYMEEKGADINRVSKVGLTSLHMAAIGNSVSILDHLLCSPKLIHTISTKSKNGRIPLFCAIESGSLDTARFLLERSNPIDILGKTNDGHTCLHYAVISGKPQLVSLLQDCGICHYDQTEEGLTALHYAVKCPNPGLLRTLLGHIDRVTLAVCDPFTYPAIIDTSAIRQNRQGAWTVQDFSSNRFLDLPSQSGKTAMQLLISADPFIDEEEVMFADLAYRVGIDLENLDREKRTPLVSLASRLSNNPNNASLHRAIGVLLELGVDINAKDRTGRTALHYLCGARTFTYIIHQAIASLIAGEEWTAERLFGLRPLRRAFISTSPPPPLPPPPGHSPSSAKRFRPPPSRNHPVPTNPPPRPSSRPLKIEWKNASGTAGVDILDQSKETALQAFFRRMNRMPNNNQTTEIALRLLELSSKVGLDRQFSDGARLFDIAIINKNDRLIKKLYDLGVNTTDRDSILGLRSPLGFFCVWGARDVEVLKELISTCKNLSQLDTNGLSLLHLACEHGHLKVVQELLDGGMNINIKSRQRNTALSYAVTGGHTSIVELLLENGATVETRIGHRYWRACLLNQVSNVTICKLLEDRGVNDWTERTSCTVPSIFIPDFSTSHSCGQNGDKWTSRLLTRLTPLHYIAYFGYLDVFKYAVEHGKDVDLNIEADFGITPLFFAILVEDEPLVTFLLQHGAKVNALYRPRGWTMLHLAACIGNEWVALELLSNGADPCATDYSSITPSIIALQVGHLGLSSTLQNEEKTRKAESKPENSKSEEATDQKISPALTDAIIKGNLELCQRLVERGFNIEGTCECGCTPLIKAYARHRHKIALYLLSIGASVEGITCDDEYGTAGFSVLHYAASTGNEEILEAIIEKSPCITEKGPQAVHIAARQGHVKALQILFRHVDDPKSLLEAKSDGTPMAKYYDRYSYGPYRIRIGIIKQGTPLHFAAGHNHIEVVEFLLRAGADLEARDEKGLTALQHSLNSSTSTDVTELLVSAGANLNSRSSEGQTPLMRAAQGGFIASLQVILSKPDEEVLHARDSWGKTALHHAVEMHQFSAAEELVKLGAKVTILDYANISPLHSALIRDEDQFVLAMLSLPEVDTHFSETFGSLLNMAMSRNKIEMVNELLKRIPDEQVDRYVNLNCEMGTLLYASASLGNTSIMGELVDKGAIVNLVGGPLGTPLMGACEMGQVEAVLFLLKKGAELECVKPNGTKATAEQAARGHDSIQLILQRFKEKGGKALDDEIPAKKADVEKMGKTLLILEEREKERGNQRRISDVDTDMNTDSNGSDVIDVDMW